MPVAVERGRVAQVVRDAEERLAQQERAEPGGEERHHQRRVGVVPARGRRSSGRLVTNMTSNGTIIVARNTTNSVRFERELEERERVAGEDRGDHLTDDDQAGRR